MHERDRALFGRLLPLLALALLVAGCRSVGPEQIREGRGDYNAAIQQTSAEQLLLNIVRLRYRDTPVFLEVTSVTTSFSTDASTDLSSAFASGTRSTFGAGVGLSFSEEPTVTYAPLQGEQFVTQLMSPLELRTVVLLYHSGWNVDRILRLTARSMNGLLNAPRASGPTPDTEPEFRAFARVTALLRDLQHRNGVALGLAPAPAPEGEEADPAAATAMLHLHEDEVGGEAAREFARLLGLDEGASNYVLGAGLDGGDPTRVGLALRSFMATLFYVSQSVQVPAAHEEAGLVTVTRAADGSVFDWSEMTGDLITIRSGDTPSPTAYVTVPYRGAWFWIDDTDLTSKSTFALMQQILALQSGEVDGAAPVLTLSIGD